MPELKDVLEDVHARGVSAFGEDVPTLRKSVEKDLADVRKLAEDAGGSPRPPRRSRRTSRR